MKKIIECVPNFSEGRDLDTIENIAAAIRDTAGCSLLDVNPGQSTNRTVYTFVGGPESVVAGALAAARVAKERIDMRHHTGEHPRFGAMDVCPFIPVAGVSMAECVAVAERFAERAAEELQVPFYLYEEAARHESRRRLPDVRKGEYEALSGRLEEARWCPDYGPSEFVPSWGATATGARRFLIAYNVNILSTVNQAHRIALTLREAGRGPGKEGRLKDVKGMGWFVSEFNMAQVSVNLNDYEVTGIHTLFEEVRAEAKALQLAVAGSEIVGIVPLASLLQAADYYIEKESLFIYEEEQKVRLAIERLGLNSVAPFIPEERIIEYIVAEAPEAPLVQMGLGAFIKELGARTSAPGGGSASAAIAAMGVALGAMVAKLTHGVRRFEGQQHHMMAAIPDLHRITGELSAMIDADTSAFNDYMAGMRMAKDTEVEKKLRSEKMEQGLKTAIKVPLATMRLGDSVWQQLIVVARYGNPASKSDTQVGARALETGIWGAYQNVLINMEGLDDLPHNAAYRETVQGEAAAIEARARKNCAEILAILEKS